MENMKIGIIADGILRSNNPTIILIQHIKMKDISMFAPLMDTGILN
jgi:hypothetical protein